ncbi:MAG: M13 family metallopeptidase [Thermoanaerobaculia bacterium]|nr:M13 family metallopeptidase [Thermoanaerobaculia bacterium]
MRFRSAILACLVAAGCATQQQTSVSSSGFDPASLDRGATACNDFYQFAIGGWMKKNPVPAAYSRWGSFHALDKANQEKMRTLLDDAARGGAPAGSDKQRVGDYYASCMDTAASEKAGIKPLETHLARIDALTSPHDLPRLFAYLHALKVTAGFGFGSTPDLKQSDRVVAGAGQSGLGLPDRDYYTKDDEKSKEIRDRYAQHVARMLQFLGDSPADAATAAKNIMVLETKLAESSMTNVQLRDPNALYNKMTIAELKALSLSFDWDGYFAAAGVNGLQTIIVAQPEFMREFGRQVKSQSVETWKDYLRWRLIDITANSLSSNIVDANFDFFGRYLEGKKELQPRWRRCATYADVALGEAVGRLWTDRYFPATAKAEAMEMVQNLMAALRTDINTLAWMGPETRTRASEKLEAFGTKIGYPDVWRDYSALTLNRGPYAANEIAANAFEVRRDLSKIGKAVDRNEWLLSPPTVNAYNNPLMNEIVFPAGILQPPFYDPNADDAYNYGGMGAVIGHELIHGFDDEGRQYDAKGNLADWWTAEDKQRFLERAKCVSEQFSGFDLGDGLRMTGDLVLGESIADLGGLEIAYAAYRKSQEGKPRNVINGFTPEQRFFLGWAQVWAATSTREADRLQVTTDPHPLPKYRVNGPLANMPSFAEAYGCRTNDKMVTAGAERCDIW